MTTPVSVPRRISLPLLALLAAGPAGRGEQHDHGRGYVFETHKTSADDGRWRGRILPPPPHGTIAVVIFPDTFADP